MALFAFPRFFYAQYVHGQSLDNINDLCSRANANANPAYNGNNQWSVEEEQNPNNNNWQLVFYIDGQRSTFQPVPNNGYVIMSGNSLDYGGTPELFNETYAVGTLFGDQDGPYNVSKSGLGTGSANGTLFGD